jgi:hypothetical protein
LHSVKKKKKKKKKKKQKTNCKIGEVKRKADCRYVDSMKQALILYDLIYQEKVQQKIFKKQ